jgi:D-sedoheptulose 7-phosphate isomerase
MTVAADTQFLNDYFGRLETFARPNEAVFEQLGQVRDLWERAKEAGGKVIFIGNGGSAGIASHLAIDLGKNGHIPAACFNDGAQITCLSNDYGFENWIAHALRIQGKPEDTLVAISSSGNSKNILNAVEQARKMGISVATCSAMNPENALRKLGDVNLWADSHAYNVVETVHQFWMMAVIDMIIGTAEYPPN